MNRIKAYIIWLWLCIPKVKLVRYDTCRNKTGRMVTLKLLLKKYCDQSPKIKPWPYNK